MKNKRFVALTATSILLVGTVAGCSQQQQDASDFEKEHITNSSSSPSATPTTKTPSPTASKTQATKKPTATTKATSTKAVDNTPKVIASNLNTPWSIAFYNKTPLISSRDTGEIYEMTTNGNHRVMGKVDGIVHDYEGGLHGLAIKDQYLYVYYTAANDNRVARFTLHGKAGSLSISDPQSILEGIPKAIYHNGGRIAFGPDQKLYITTGDAMVGTNAQNQASLSGKILRLNPDGTIPADNPFPNSPVWTLGHRNVQGITWDSKGTMYASEFGNDKLDELNIIKAGSNYGWPNIEGTGHQQGFVDPVQEWPVSEASPSGITYADSKIFIANLRGERLRVVPVTKLSTSKEYFKQTYGRIRDVAVAPDGTLWFITNNTDGTSTPKANDDKIISVPLTAFS
ncbi:MAG: PQQ-dependent sugar dehydrogenase [Micrococcaceae bacterium]